MSIREHMQGESLHMRMLKPQVMMRNMLSPVPPDKQPVRDDLELYRLTLSLRWDYWTNHRDQADQAAKRALMHFIYQDALHLIAVLRQAAMSCDQELMMATCHELEMSLSMRDPSWLP